MVYPIKSCAGIALDEARVTARGLEHDRRWMVIDEAGLLPQPAHAARDGAGARCVRPRRLAGHPSGPAGADAAAPPADGVRVDRRRSGTTASPPCATTPAAPGSRARSAAPCSWSVCPTTRAARSTPPTRAPATWSASPTDIRFWSSTAPRSTRSPATAADPWTCAASVPTSWSPARRRGPRMSGARWPSVR